MRHPILKDLTTAVEAALKDLPGSKFRKLRKLVKQARAEINVIEEDAEIKARYLKHAEENCGSDGELEFDSDAEVSLSDDGGAYVQGWHWVPASDANMCDEVGCHEPIDDGEGFDGKCGACADKEHAEKAIPEDGSPALGGGNHCANEKCEGLAFKDVPVSVNAPGDQKRKLCAICEEAYSIGVQHGSFVQNPNYASQPPKSAEHTQPAKPSTTPAAKVGRAKKSSK